MMTTESLEQVNQVELTKKPIKKPVNVDNNTTQIQIVDENKQFT